MRASLVRLARCCLRARGRVAACVVVLAVITTSACSASAGRKPAEHQGSSGAGASQPSGTPSRTSPSPRPVPDKTVQPPVPGNIEHTVAAVPLATLAPVALAATARYGTGVTGKIVKIVPVNAEGDGPGEISGPAVAVTVEIDNGSAKPLPLTDVVANLYGAKGSPGVPVGVATYRPLSGTVRPGGHAVGTYAFTISTADRDPITVSISYSPTAPVALFVGAVK